MADIYALGRFQLTARGAMTISRATLLPVGTKIIGVADVADFITLTCDGMVIESGGTYPLGS